MRREGRGKRQITSNHSDQTDNSGQADQNQARNGGGAYYCVRVQSSTQVLA